MFGDLPFRLWLDSLGWCAWTPGRGLRVRHLQPGDRRLARDLAALRWAWLRPNPAADDANDECSTTSADSHGASATTYCPFVCDTTRAHSIADEMMKRDGVPTLPYRDTTELHVLQHIVRLLTMETDSSQHEVLLLALRRIDEVTSTNELKTQDREHARLTLLQRSNKATTFSTQSNVTQNCGSNAQPPLRPTPIPPGTALRPGVREVEDKMLSQQHDNDMFVEASVEAMEEALRTFREGDRIAATWRERPAPNGIEVDTHPVTHIGTVIAPWSDTLRGLQRVRWDRGQQRLTPPYNTPFPECHLPDPEIAYAIPLKISFKAKATTATDAATRAPCRTQDEGPVVVRTAATTAARARARKDDETTRTTPTPPRIVDEPEDTPDDDDYDDDKLAPLPDLWTAEAVQTPSFQCGGTRTPEPAAMKGSTLTKIILDETSTPALAKAGLTKTTRQGHRRFIRHLATLPITLHTAPLPTAIVEYINIERRQRRWQWSTTLTRMAAIQGALRLLPLYARHHHPIDLRNDPTWTQAMRTVRRETQCETAFQPRAASPNDIRLAVERESNLQTQCALIVAWITAARGGCTLQLRHENITIDGNQAIIQFRRGKSVIARGPYTVHTTIPPWAIDTLTAFVTRRRRGLLFPKTTGEQLKLALRRVHSALEQRSIRRGSLQAMSRGGTSDEDLLLYSGHTNLRTLRRYLDWGRASGDLKRRMPQQADNAL